MVVRTSVDAGFVDIQFTPTKDIPPSLAISLRQSLLFLALIINWAPAGFVLYLGLIQRTSSTLFCKSASSSPRSPHHRLTTYRFALNKYIKFRLVTTLAYNR
jgi:hypothetical protein